MVLKIIIRNPSKEKIWNHRNVYMKFDETKV